MRLSLFLNVEFTLILAANSSTSISLSTSISSHSVKLLLVFLSRTLSFWHWAKLFLASVQFETFFFLSVGAYVTQSFIHSVWTLLNVFFFAVQSVHSLRSIDFVCMFLCVVAAPPSFSASTSKFFSMAKQTHSIRNGNFPILFRTIHAHAFFFRPVRFVSLC